MLNNSFIFLLLRPDAQGFHCVVKSAQHGKKESIFSQRTDSASAEQYFQVRLLYILSNQFFSLLPYFYDYDRSDPPERQMGMSGIGDY